VRSGSVLASCDHGIDQVLEDDADGTDGVVISRNRELDERRIRVGINEGDDWNVQATSFSDGDGLASGVDDDDSIWLLVHVAHTAKVTQEFFALTAEGCEFLLGHGLELRLFLDVFEVFETLYGLTNGETVGEHAAEPAVVDVVLASGFSSFADGVLRLALAADEEDFFPFSDEVSKEVGSLVELLDGFLEIDDVDAASVLHEEGLHAWIPLFGLVAVVDASVHHFVDEFVYH
jgi:hypothetical protein